MLNYQSINYNYRLLLTKLWGRLFKHNFKKCGRSSSIAFPLKIQNSQYIEIGENVHILYKTWLSVMKIDENIPRLLIEDNSRIGHFSTISCVRNVRIGRSVLISDNVYIADNMHEYEDITRPIYRQPTKFIGSVNIGDNSWIGKNASIIGVNIGKHCVIGANSVVTKSISDYSVAVGAPARIIRKYNFKIKGWQVINEKQLVGS